VLNHPYPYQKVHHSFPAKHTVDKTSAAGNFWAGLRITLNLISVSSQQQNEKKFHFAVLFCQKALKNNFFSSLLHLY
jgi:hypothetical protein